MRLLRRVLAVIAFVPVELPVMFAALGILVAVGVAWVVTGEDYTDNWILDNRALNWLLDIPSRLLNVTIRP